MQLTNLIHQLQIDFIVQFAPERIVSRFVNVFVIFGEKITLVDTGVKGSEEQIFSYIVENGRTVSEIETVILSHAHPDHIGAAARIKELTGCKVLAHELETDWIENIRLQEKQRPVPGFSNLVDRPVKVDEFLHHQQLLSIAAKSSLKILHTPGHSKGMVSLLFPEEKALFTADAIPLKNDIPNYNNYSQLMQSLNQIRKNLNQNILLSSWAPALQDKTEIEKLIADGETYLKQIGVAVKENYLGKEAESFQFCKKTINQLGMPPFFVNPIVDSAFRSHLITE